MFKDLRPNTPFYVFDKGETINFQVGTVASVSAPILKPATQYNTAFPMQPEYTVDIKVKVGETPLNFNGLPANSAIADYTANNNKVVVSANRDLIKTEVETTLANSKSVIASIANHESNVKECERILESLNPTYAKEKEQEAEIKRLNETVAEMKKQLGGLDEIKQMLLEQQKKSTTSNNPVKK